VAGKPGRLAVARHGAVQAGEGFAEQVRAVLGGRRVP